MVGLITSECYGTLRIDGFDMNTPAWLFPDLRPLWLLGATTGRNLPVTGANGDRPLRRFRTTTEWSLRFLISAEVDRFGMQPFGTTQLGMMQQLQANIDYLNANVLEVVESDEGTRTLELTKPLGDVVTVEGHVNPALTIVKAAEGGLVTLLDLSVPDGQFA